MKFSFAILIMLSSFYCGAQEKLFYHDVRTDKEGNIIPWYDDDPGKSFSHVILSVWNFWDTMRHDMNGLPYYMNHQVWNPAVDDHRGMGGDQLAMALSSWRLLYDYTGNERIKENMRFIADYYLTHGVSPANAKWPNIIFPYNTLIYSGIFDGDMRAGRDVAQPDKAGSFALELIRLYKIEDEEIYLDAAIKTANTLASYIKPGDIDHSPLPFKVNVFTGRTALLRHHDFTGGAIDSAGYTSNWVPTMMMFRDLIALKKGNTAAYQRAFDILLAWMKKYPLPNNKWGPFFEDVDWWSETQINAMTFARFMMENPQYFPEWKTQVKGIIDWVHKNFNNDGWKKYGVIVTNEQTVYPQPGESHTSRQGADELLYVSLTGDTSLYTNALRELIWATYTVDFDGRNLFPHDEPWLTDGYGDYVRHYLRAMATFPELAPNEDHILSTTSVILQSDYKGNLKKFQVPDFDKVDSSTVNIFYKTFDAKGTEKIKMKSKPSQILIDNKPLAETVSGEGFQWLPLSKGGLLVIRRMSGKQIIIVE